MQAHEFHAAFANTPLANRKIVIGGKKKPITLTDIYEKVRVIEDNIRPQIIELDNLLKLAEASKLLVPRGLPKE